MRTPLGIAFNRPWPTSRRGLNLWLLSLMMLAKGVGYLRGAVSTSTDEALGLITQRLHIPIEVFGAAMVSVCLFAIFCSYCHHGRDRYGYMALVAFSLAWAAVFAFSALFLGAPTSGFQGMWNGTIFALFLLFSAADPEPVIDHSDDHGHWA